MPEIEITLEKFSTNKVVTWDQCAVNGVEAKEFVLRVKAGEPAYLMVESYVYDKDGKIITTVDGDSCLKS
jgi:hypothetical protein